MEQSFPLSGPTAPLKGVRIRQNLAALLFVLSLLLNLIRAFAPYALDLQWGGPLLSGLGVLLLLPLAANDATRRAVTVAGAWCAVSVLFYAILPGLFSSASDLESVGRYHMALSLFGAIGPLVWIWSLATILRANLLETPQRSWIGVLIVTLAGGWIHAATFIYVNAFDVGILWNANWISILTGAINQILAMIAWVVLARCAAFSGRRVAGCVQRGACNPLNRYVVGALVAALVTTLALWAYYRYAVPELRELLDWKFMRLH